jgi:hypothetical protein
LPWPPSLQSTPRFIQYRFRHQSVEPLARAAGAPLTAIGLLCAAGAIILRIGTMPALRKPWPLWHLLIVLGCTVIAPLLLFGVYTGLRITDAQLSGARNDLMSKAGELSADVDREIVGKIVTARVGRFRLAATRRLRGVPAPG